MKLMTLYGCKPTDYMVFLIMTLLMLLLIPPMGYVTDASSDVDGGCVYLTVGGI